MRKAINENPLVQIGLLAVLAMAAGLLLITRMGSGGSEAPPPATTPAPTSPTAVSPSTSVSGAPVTPSPTPEPAAPSPSATSPGGGSATATGFVAGPGLPKPVVEAYDSGDAVVLMIYRRKGVDDPFVFQAKRLIEALPASSGIEASVILVQAKDIARYSRITEGVDVSRVPAIVVIKPKDLSDGVPTASVSYGVRGPASVVQAVKDTLYDGRQLPYYPE